MAATPPPSRAGAAATTASATGVASPAGRDQAVIESAAPRRNELHRSNKWRSKRLAANVDQVAVVVAPSPPFSPELLDRVLAAAQAEDIDAAIIANKVDLADAQRAIEPRLALYESLGYRVFRISAGADPAGARAALCGWLAGRTTLLAGQSGMGKSTLVNALRARRRAGDAGDLAGAVEAAGTRRHSRGCSRCRATAIRAAAAASSTRRAPRPSGWRTCRCRSSRTRCASSCR